MCDDAVMMVMAAMRIITADLMTRYCGLFSSEVCYRFAIQTVIQEVRCVLKVCAEAWVFADNDE